MIGDELKCDICLHGMRNDFCVDVRREVVEEIRKTAFNLIGISAFCEKIFHMKTTRFDKFENVRVRVLDFGMFKKGASAFLPGFGIIVGRSACRDVDLLKHEFGHYLQYQKSGLYFYWRHIAFTSLLSYRRSRRKDMPYFRHYDTWTEWSANRMSWEYFNRPDEWNHGLYPIRVLNTRSGCRFPDGLHKTYSRFVSDYPKLEMGFSQSF